jgi:hypothetical protein
MNHLSLSVGWMLAGVADTSALPQHHLASVRLRSAVCAQALARPGCGVAVGEKFPAGLDVVLVGKIGSDQVGMRAEAWVHEVRRLRELGARVVVDYTDHHLSHSGELARFYRDLFQMAHALVVPSQAMSNMARPLFQGCIEVIAEPLEVSITPWVPRNSAGITRALWFGHGSNLPYLIEFLLNWDSRNPGIFVDLYSNREALQALARQNIRLPHGVRVDASAWSLAAVQEAAKLADICILPAGLDDPRKAGASANRLLTALALGLPVAADLLPAYSDFKDYFVDIRSPEFSNFLRDFQAQGDRVRAAQKQVLPAFERTLIEERWYRFLSRLSNDARN